jgi:hypothetical protein
MLGASSREETLRCCSLPQVTGLEVCYVLLLPSLVHREEIELTLRSMPLGRPQISIKMASIVSNGALLFKDTHTKDLAGIQSLFSQGLAAPSDAGHLDGCAARHVSFSLPELE